MKLVVLDGYTENPGDLSWEALRAFGEVTIYERTSYVDAPIIAERLQDADIAVVNKTPITKQTLDACPHLKLICVLATATMSSTAPAQRKKAFRSATCRHTARRRSAVCHRAASGLCHHIGHHSETVHAGRWANNADWCYWDYPMVELAGKTIGIIGFGRIGQGRPAESLPRSACAFWRTARTKVTKGAESARMWISTRCCASPDVISLHCPLTKDNAELTTARQSRR